MTYKFFAIIFLAISALHTMVHDDVALVPTNPYLRSPAFKKWHGLMLEEHAKAHEQAVKLYGHEIMVACGSLGLLLGPETTVLKDHGQFALLKVCLSEIETWQFVLIKSASGCREKKLSELMDQYKDINPEHIVDLGNPFDDGSGYWIDRAGKNYILRKMALVVYQDQVDS